MLWKEKMARVGWKKNFFPPDAFTPCGAADSLLEAFTIAAVNADFIDVTGFSAGSLGFDSFKKTRRNAGGFGWRLNRAKRRAQTARAEAGSLKAARASRSSAENFNSICAGILFEEKIPAPNNQHKNITSNRKDAHSAYPK